MTTLTDRRVWQTNPDRWVADAISGQDYDPFGMVRPNRSVREDGYRFGFNGKEKDSEFSNESYDFGARIYDGRVARWLSVDPKADKYVGHTPYCFTINNPIIFEDFNGEDLKYKVTMNADGSKTLTVVVNAKMVNKSSQKQSYTEMAALKSNIEDKTYRTYAGKSFIDTDGKKVNVSVSINITLIDKIENVQQNDHVIVLVDKVEGTHVGEANGIVPSVISNSSLVATKDHTDAQITHTAVHEGAHNLGAYDEYKVKDGKVISPASDNLMGAGTSSYNLRPDQLKTMFSHLARTGKSDFQTVRNQSEKLNEGDTRKEVKDLVNDYGKTSR